MGRGHRPPALTTDHSLTLHVVSVTVYRGFGCLSFMQTSCSNNLGDLRSYAPAWLPTSMIDCEDVVAAPSVACVSTQSACLVAMCSLRRPLCLKTRSQCGQECSSLRLSSRLGPFDEPPLPELRHGCHGCHNRWHVQWHVQPRSNKHIQGLQCCLQCYNLTRTRTCTHCLL